MRTVLIQCGFAFWPDSITHVFRNATAMKSGTGATVDLARMPNTMHAPAWNPHRLSLVGKHDAARSAPAVKIIGYSFSKYQSFAK